MVSKTQLKRAAKSYYLSLRDGSDDSDNDAKKKEYFGLLGDIIAEKRLAGIQQYGGHIPANQQWQLVEDFMEYIKIPVTEALIRSINLEIADYIADLQRRQTRGEVLSGTQQRILARPAKYMEQTVATRIEQFLEHSRRFARDYMLRKESQSSTPAKPRPN